MPVYVYKCDKCNSTVELLRKINDTEVIRCDNCGEICYKQLTAPAFALNGVGCYKPGLRV